VKYRPSNTVKNTPCVALFSSRPWCAHVTVTPEASMEHPALGSTRSPNCINCTKADVRLRTSDDGQKDCPKQVES
jgi:hypothetical protein